MTVSEPKSNEDISSCFKTAIERLDRVKEDAEKKKTEIVQDLAKDLEGKIPTNRISNEIVHQLRGKGVSETLIRRCLDQKYKEKHRVANARKQKKKVESTDDLAAPVPLNNGDIDPQKKKIIIDTSGNEIRGPEPSVIEATDYDSTKEIIAQSSPMNVANCEQCEIKDTKIRELEDVVSKTIQITPANEIAEDKQNRTTQPLTQAIAENGFNDNNLETKEEPAIKPSFNDEIISPIKQAENLTDTKKEVLVSHISMSFEGLRKDMATVFQTTKGIGKIFFKVSVDIGTSLVEIQFCGITQDNTMTSTGKGKLKEAGTNFLLGS